MRLKNEHPHKGSPHPAAGPRTARTVLPGAACRHEPRFATCVAAFAGARQARARKSRHSRDSPPKAAATCHCHGPGAAHGKRGRKKATPQGGFLALKKPDDVLLSRARSSLSSALRRFTVLFGMGRGGSTAPWSSDIAVRPPVPGMGTERPIRKEDIATIDHDPSCHPAGTG